MCIALCTTVAHNIAQNRPDNFPSYPPDNHHCSDDVYLREGGSHHQNVSVQATRSVSPRRTTSVTIRRPLFGKLFRSIPTYMRARCDGDDRKDGAAEAGDRRSALSSRMHYGRAPAVRPARPARHCPVCHGDGHRGRAGELPILSLIAPRDRPSEWVPRP